MIFSAYSGRLVFIKGTTPFLLYNCLAFFTKTYNPADDQMFKSEVEKAGAKCAILYANDFVKV